MKYWLTVLLCISGILLSYGQNSQKVIIHIHTENSNDLIVGINNYISIVAEQNTPVTQEQVRAFLFTESQYFYGTEPIQLKVEQEYGKFKIRPDSLGAVEFRVEINGKTETTRVSTVPIPAVCRLGRYKANSETKIPAVALKAQTGMIAYVECCGIDARCKVMEYEVIRVGANSRSASVHNAGGKFEEISRDLIHQARSGDIYVFRNIYYQCPGTEKQRSEDMIFEIK